MESLWESDIFNLPPEVAFPGSDWLNRIASDETAYVASNGQAYTSTYAAMLENEPLKYPCRNFNAYINSIFIPSSFAGKVADNFGLELAHYILCYLRNFVGAIVVYYGVAAIFHYFCYIHPVSHETFEKRGRPRPSTEIMWDQIKLAQMSMTLYVMLPVLDEYIVEQGWTKVYFTIAEIGGWTNYAMYFVLYFALVEIGIYWMHRTLHTNKWMYKHIHLLHHKYNKPETLTPWASIAFHPLDGILQASPYVAALPIVPCHYLTHFILLFFTAVWATYIHDAMDLNIDPVMGSKYHTVHHTHYIYNYGQVFTFCDRFWNTYREPDGPTGVANAGKPRTRPTSGRGVSKKVN
eukprot:CAMPEP_0172452248 /NCGR_PEP_ID=MMETSP1065-20121228/9972_1 /TAXON_ID=265537 /ORGANISM="Amphiprora paludosa, Strain CCMP125" /LENGTH=349 /DNA_ID=CAMNT_0013204285 /DNA_START=91 /DNA_END=1140 /DNA_ORIENTATION=-